MRAYRLDNPAHTIGAEDLATQGLLSWSVSSNEGERTAMIDKIKRERGYVDQDFIALLPDTPNLETICAKFDKEHYHTEDEVRAWFATIVLVDLKKINAQIEQHVRDAADRWIRIEVSEGDIIIIPARTHHRFYLTDSKTIRCMRLFANHDGWAPLYRAAVEATSR